MADTESPSHEIEGPKKSFFRRMITGDFPYVKTTFSISIILVVIVIGMVLRNEVVQVEETHTVVNQQEEDWEEDSWLSSDTIEKLIQADEGVLTLREAEDLILKYSKTFTTMEHVESLLRHVVHVECDVDGDIGEGSGVFMRTYENEDQTEWHVYTNAHITGVDPKKIRLCRVAIPRTAGSDTSDKKAVDTYEAVVVRVAGSYPDVDFTELKLIDPKIIPDMPLERCSFDDNKIGDRVMIIGYPTDQPTITNGIIKGFPTYSYRDAIVETTAKIYPGHSGGMGFNLSKDCSIGLATWSTDDITFISLIQSWDMFKPRKPITK